MIRLIALHEHLKTAGVVNPETMEIRAEDGDPEWAEDTGGPDMLLFRNAYTGVIEFFNARGNILDLLAAVLVWLHDNIPEDEREGNRLVDWEGEPVDNTHSDVTMRFAFSEEVRYVPAAAGYAGKDKVTLNGADWKRGAITADRATTLQDPVIGQTT